MADRLTRREVQHVLRRVDLRDRLDAEHRDWLPRDDQGRWLSGPAYALAALHDMQNLILRGFQRQRKEEGRERNG